jgi:hypothetical protein
MAALRQLFRLIGDMLFSPADHRPILMRDVQDAHG